MNSSLGTPRGQVPWGRLRGGAGSGRRGNTSVLVVEEEDDDDDDDSDYVDDTST